MNNYWLNRGLKLVDETYTKGNKIIYDINKEFGRAMASIERDLSYYLERIAIDNKLSYQEARKKLKKGEFEVFRMSLKQYIEKGEGVLTEKTIKELVNASNMHNISRLQAMGLEMKKHIDYLYNKYNDNTENLLSTTYEMDFYKSMYDLQKVTGYKTLRKIDSDVLYEIVKKPWTADGKNFSDRIWTQQETLIHELQSSLMQKCIMGTSTETLINDLSKRMDVSFSKSKRLIETELSYFSNKALADSYQKGSCKKYEIVATLDTKTSEICRAMDGKVFDFKDMKQGINAPPFHCYCRSVIIPAYGDEIEKELDEQAGRIARNPITGKSEKVGNITYEDWFNKYVKADKQAEKEYNKSKNIKSDYEEYKKYKKILGVNKVGDFEKFQDLKYNDSNKWERLQDNYYIKNKFDKGIWEDKINIDKQKRHMKSTAGRNKSYFDDNVDVYALYEKYKMTGELDIRKGVRTHQELINFDEIVDAFDFYTGKKANGMTIHYSKTGVHLVPTYHKED